MGNSYFALSWEIEKTPDSSRLTWHTRRECYFAAVRVIYVQLLSRKRLHRCVLMLDRIRTCLACRKELSENETMSSGAELAEIERCLTQNCHRYL